MGSLVVRKPYLLLIVTSVEPVTMTFLHIHVSLRAGVDIRGTLKRPLGPNMYATCIWPFVRAMVARCARLRELFCTLPIGVNVGLLSKKEFGSEKK